MDIKRLAIGTLVGGIVVYGAGVLIFDMAFRDFYAANVGSATGVDRTQQVFWAVMLGALGYAALVTLAIGSRPGSASIAASATAGAVVGCLIWFTADFTLYSITNIQNLTRSVVDPMLELVRGGIAGGVIGLVLGKIG